MSVSSIPARHGPTSMCAPWLQPRVTKSQDRNASDLIPITRPRPTVPPRTTVVQRTTGRRPASRYLSAPAPTAVVYIRAAARNCELDKCEQMCYTNAVFLRLGHPARDRSSCCAPIHPIVRRFSGANRLTFCARCAKMSQNDPSRRPARPFGSRWVRIPPDS